MSQDRQMRDSSRRVPRPALEGAPVAGQQLAAAVSTAQPPDRTGGEPSGGSRKSRGAQSGARVVSRPPDARFEPPGAAAGPRRRSGGWAAASCGCEHGPASRSHRRSPPAARGSLEEPNRGRRGRPPSPPSPPPPPSSPSPPSPRVTVDECRVPSAEVTRNRP